MVKSVIREFQWLPTKIGSFFIDGADHLGLEFWYNDVLEVNEKLKPKPKPEKK